MKQTNETKETAAERVTRLRAEITKAEAQGVEAQKRADELTKERVPRS
jgi:hypothetical protein